MDTAVLVEHNMEPTHMSPNPLRCPPPSTPLHQLSPERINQQRMPLSPSLPSFANENDRPRTRDSFSSDVQSKVAFLNSLAHGTGTGSVQSSPTRPPRGNTNSNNALQRAVMGYEEAQASLATLTAELERAKEEMSSRKKRERMLAQRVDELLEDLQAEKEKRCRDQESYAKEIKRCRKEAYRAELAVVEARQDLQEARSELKRSQAEVQHEKAEKEKSRQESFERAYALAGVVGELEQLKDQLKVIEKERDAALLEVKANKVEMNVSMEDEDKDKVATNRQPEKGQSETSKHAQQQPEPTVSLKRSIETMEEPEVSESMAPRDILKFTLDIYDKRMQGEKLTPQEEIRYLKQELRCARQKHAEDADMMHFMHMQCQFKACPCRLAEEKGDRFVHDYAYEAAVDQARASKKRKISNQRTDPQPAQVPFEDKGAQANASTDVPFHDAPQALPEPIKDEETYRLPPDPIPDHLSRISEEPLLLEEAVEVPLPEPQPMELDSREVTPEPTAQLEEITQVIVEPGTTSKPFSFSTSTTSNPALRAATPSLRHTESATTVLERQREQEHDLFDLSPPKQAPPRRPSTAMGILMIDSPIRLVPDSPRSLRSSEHEMTRSTTPTYDYHHPNNYNHTITTTTKIALKGSPQRNSLHRRAQSRPDIRSHSPLRSSAMSHVSDPDTESFPRPVFAKDTSASPASTTLFPVTPLHKHAKSAQLLAQSQPRPAPAPTAMTSITTRVPLKGFADAEGNDQYSPEKPGHRYNYGHAHTEVLNVNMSMNMNFNPDVHANPLRTSTASNGSDTFSNRASQAGTIPTSILGSVPGTPISREAALAQIRARRDRARSVNLKLSSTGKENGMTGSGKAGSPMKPKVVGGAGMFGRDKENVRREISQASAPGRFGY